ncbi:MAG: AraC family transcriptional regulator [Dehalogenimonas sp.]
MGNQEKIKAVQLMQDCIQRHLQEPINLYMLAQAAGYSPSYSSRIFKEVIGKNPFEYIRVMRLSEAAVKLRDAEVKVIDVAFDFVFESHEGFTRAFSRQFSVNPRSYRKNKPDIRLFLPLRASDYYLKNQKGKKKMIEKSQVATIFVQVVDRPERKLILKRGKKAADYYAYCEEVGGEVWNELVEIKDALYEPIGMWLPENLVTPGTSVYAQGVEVPRAYEGPVPDGFELISLSSCQMMVFQGQPYDDSKYEEAIGSLWEVMKNYDPKIYGFDWADSDGPRFQLEPMGYRGYIEARPVRPLNTR